MLSLNSSQNIKAMSQLNFDCLIIGAGAAGLMAGWAAAKKGLSVGIVEAQAKPGLKILAAGGGRCNLTHTGDTETFLNHYHEAKSFLYSSFHQWGNKDMMTLCQHENVPLKNENGRIFPASEKSLDILNLLLKLNHRFKVQFFLQSKLVSITPLKQSHPANFKLLFSTSDPHNKVSLLCKNLIICTGGASYPKLGGNSESIALIKSLGHQIQTFTPALTSILCQEQFGQTLAGIQLNDCSLLLKNKQHKTIATEEGALLFTHQGLSGPAAINLSRFLGRLTPEKFKETKLLIHFKNLATEFKGDQAFLHLKNENPKFQPLQHFQKFLPKKLAAFLYHDVCQLNKINLAEFNHQELAKLQNLSQKGWSLHPDKLPALDSAMVSCGGILLKEVQPKTMASKLIPHLYFAGECLNIDGRSGGYNLQAAFSTGYTAGNAVASDLK